MLEFADNQSTKYDFVVFGKEFYSIDDAFLYFTLNEKERDVFYKGELTAQEYEPSYKKKEMSDDAKVELLSLIVKERIVQNQPLADQILNCEFEDDQDYESDFLNYSMYSILESIRDSLEFLNEEVVEIPVSDKLESFAQSFGLTKDLTEDVVEAIRVLEQQLDVSREDLSVLSKGEIIEMALDAKDRVKEILDSISEHLS